MGVGLGIKWRVLAAEPPRPADGDQSCSLPSAPSLGHVGQLPQGLQNSGAGVHILSPKDHRTGLLRDQSLRPGAVREPQGARRPPAGPALMSPPWKAPYPPAPSGRLPHAPGLLLSLHSTEDRPHSPGAPHCPATGGDRGIVLPAGPALRQPGGSPHIGHEEVASTCDLTDVPGAQAFPSPLPATRPAPYGLWLSIRQHAW